MLKLAPSAEQCESLLATMRACNAAASRAAEVAFEHRTANKMAVQKLVYTDLRQQFGLSAQMAIRSIAKACEAYKRDKKIKPVFRELGAVAFDQRILSWKGPTGLASSPWAVGSSSPLSTRGVGCPPPGRPCAARPISSTATGCSFSPW
jgi:predicted transposase